VMCGMATMLPSPRRGRRAPGRRAPSPAVLATDLGAGRHRAAAHARRPGDFVEFFGPGRLDVERRATARSSPTWRPSTARPTGFFTGRRHTRSPTLRDTGRRAEAVELSERYTRRNALWLRSRGDAALQPQASRSSSPASACTSAAAAAAAGPARLTPTCRPCSRRSASCRRRGARALPRHPVRGGRDHELHQHLGPGAPDRRRPRGAQGRGNAA
jgi:hypothetical protein